MKESRTVEGNWSKRESGTVLSWCEGLQREKKERLGQQPEPGQMKRAESGLWFTGETESGFGLGVLKQCFCLVRG